MDDVATAAEKGVPDPQAAPVQPWEAYVAMLAGLAVVALGWWFGYEGFLGLTVATSTAGTAIAGACALPQFVILLWADRSDELLSAAWNRDARKIAGIIGGIGIALLVFFAGALTGATFAAQ